MEFLGGKLIGEINPHNPLHISASAYGIEHKLSPGTIIEKAITKC